MTVTPSDANIEKWYVMAAYKFELKAEESLREAGFEVYLPKETVYVKKPRRRPVAIERPAISTLIFVHASLSRIIDYKRHIDDRLKFRMTPLFSSRTTTLSSASAASSQTKAPPAATFHPYSGKSYLTVPDSQMAAFISIWASRDTLQASLSPLLQSTRNTTSSPSSARGTNSGDSDAGNLNSGPEPHAPSASLPGQNTPISSPTSAGTLPAGTTVEIISGPLTGLRATTLTPITSRSRTTRLSLPLASLLSITLTLPTSSLSAYI